MAETIPLSFNHCLKLWPSCSLGICLGKPKPGALTSYYMRDKYGTAYSTLQRQLALRELKLSLFLFHSAALFVDTESVLLYSGTTRRPHIRHELF